MDVNLLSELLLELVLDNDKISLPGIGCFIAEDAPARFSADGSVIFPPFRKISFRTSEVSDDDLLESLYAHNVGKERVEIKEEFGSFFVNFRNELFSKKFIELPRFGNLRSTKEGSLFFVVSEENELLSKGLEPLNIKLLSSEPQAAQPVIDFSENIEIDDTNDLQEMNTIPNNVVEDNVDMPVIELDSSEPMPNEIPQIVDEGVRSIQSKKKSKVLPIIVILLAIIIVLFLLFRSSIADVLEGVLYTPEEMEIINSQLK